MIAAQASYDAPTAIEALIAANIKPKLKDTMIRPPRPYYSEYRS